MTKSFWYSTDILFLHQSAGRFPVCGVSNLYRTLNRKGNQIIGEIQHKWEEKTFLNFENIDISRSFVHHNSIFKDCYLKYTQFRRTLHRRFYTNDKLYKMGIKNSDKCTFCHDESDSVEHMLLRCNVIKNFWDRINNWIEEIGFIGYTLTESKIILGNLENGQTITTLILLSKKVIFQERQKPITSPCEKWNKKNSIWKSTASISNTSLTSLKNDGTYSILITKTKTKDNI